ncbi:MAG: type-F conjugative transfer system secretin TraK [Thiohalocapsa sp.]|nr:type-F conjugative transfer system secretin TraK [Thiohalocapsa sp.]
MFRNPHALRSQSTAVLVVLTLAAAGLPVDAESPFLRTAFGSERFGADAGDAQPVLELGPRTVTVKPGSNAILELAIDHLNRIVTPFSRPSVRTVSDISTEVDGNVLYVATAEETPATLYITDADDARTTVALTLAPRRVPPREVHLRVPGVEAGRKRGSADVEFAGPSAPALPPAIAATWRQPQRYIEELTAGFRAIALGEAPDGYTERRARASDTVTCGEGLGIRRARAFDGGPLRFVTARVRAKTAGTPALDESNCRLRSGAPIAAIALWPSGPLTLGAEADLIVAIRADGDDQRREPAQGRRP